MGNVNSSFGVEIECVIAVQRGFGTRPRPRMFQDAPGSPILADIDDDDWMFSSHGPIFATIESCIEEALADKVGDRVITSEAQLDDQNFYHLSKYARKWVVKRDSSVSLEDSYFVDDPVMGDYTWIDIEFNSPALRATEASFDEIRRVVNALREAFWMIAPKSAGLHVHYGRCESWISLTDLRRIAALLFAADPILTQMHPAHRRGEESRWCMSNRLYSNLALGMPAREAEAYLRHTNRDVPDELEPEPIPGPVASHAEPVSRPVRERENGFISIFERGCLEGYTFDRDRFITNAWWWMEDKDGVPGSEEGKPLDIILAARELLGCRAAPILAFLMQNGWHSRMAYNFNAYEYGVYRNWVMANGRPDPVSQTKRTIEFRQAAGTVDPDEIIAHAKIVIRLCEFATQTTMKELWKTISDLHLGETNWDWYDVFDFLVDLNLVDEAKVIQRQLAKEWGVEIVDEALGLYRYPDGAEPEPVPEQAKSLLGKLKALWSSWRSSKPPSPKPGPRPAQNVSPRRILKESEGRYEGSSYLSPDLLWLELGTEGPVLPE
ncbi:putative amidoligase enzyme-domain-containing protein [Annulohypoxylon truncatum]|uniref:putative amidoligase enzyme-domain-containing protein n=1 Tax=Annulohypoxylon truncatum TaxID=327061 RepID=UPI00200838A2|nr:putative amidoligase enzyme-domain-containing protein [Annulohypoxylon truncatum]KAI1207596.1 putative amidoligase enzyme-domain-containing protein [Annulohypoxylon truncatum]